MLSYEEMPEDNAELAKIKIDFPHAPTNEASSSKELEPELLEYLDVEGFPSAGSLTFLRTALVEDTVYWIWALYSDEEKIFATAARDKEGNVTLGCETDYYGLSPEQYILGDYYNCF